MEERITEKGFKIMNPKPKTNKNERNFRLSTEPCSLVSKVQMRTTSFRPLSPINLSSLIDNKIQHKTKTVVNSIAKFEKRISTLNQSINYEARITSREKQNIVQNFRKRLQRTSRPKAQNLRPAQKMMLQFQRQLKRIKKAQNSLKVDEIIDNSNRLEAYSASLTQETSAQNQDCVRFAQGVYVLCDGHGSNGKEVARFVCTNVFEKCMGKKKQNKISKSSIAEIFSTVQRQLDYSGIDFVFSGTTCLLIVYGDREVFVANVGDSQAIMKRQCKIEVLASQHVPSSAGEAQRIQAAGGVIRQLQVHRGKFTGPLRVWAPGKNSWGPGLPLTRCFGNKAARRYGLISEPQISTFQFHDDDHTIVMGTRTLFESMKFDTIFNVIKKNPIQNRQQICQLLAGEALKKEEGQFQKISLIIIFAWPI